MQNYLEKEREMHPAPPPALQEQEAPDLDAPAVTIGVINDTVGVIPAGPHNPEIFYTPDGEEVAAAVLLTLRLFPQHLIDHLKLGRVRIVCAHRYDEQSEQIFQNFLNNFPIGKINPDVIEISREAKMEYEQTVGLANNATNIVQVFATTSKSVRQDIAASIQFLLQQHKDEKEDVAQYPSRTPDYDGIFVNIHDLERGGKLRLSEVLAALDDVPRCCDMLQGMSDDISHVPMTVAHEISHLPCISQEVFWRGARADIANLSPDYEKDFETEDAKKIPAFLRQDKNLRERRLSQYANRFFDEEVIAPERLMAIGNLSHHKYHYFLESAEESRVELAGCAMVSAMNKEHGTDIWVSKLASILPDSFTYVARWVEKMPAVKAGDLDDALTDFECPDQQLLPREDWLELRAQQLDLD